MSATMFTDQGFTQNAMRAEMLDAETENTLAIAWRDHRDERALHRLITAHIRLAVSIAAKFKRYGAPMGDLVQEASLGLMKAAEKFDPDRGVRFSTYAMLWIKAHVQEYVMRNWSLVRVGSTSSQKSLFFNLRRVEALLERSAKTGPEKRVAEIASMLSVPERDVAMMQGRLGGGDFSLNAPQASDDEGREWIDILEDDRPDAETQVAEKRDGRAMIKALAAAMDCLTPREARIIQARRLSENPMTLESLGREMNLSKERIRQIEVASFAKLRDALRADASHIMADMH